MSNDYMDLFVEEARENIDELIAGLLRLESEEASTAGQTINELFRFAHNVKGMAATVGLDPITVVAHRSEDLLAGYRQSGDKPEKPDTGDDNTSDEDASDDDTSDDD